MANWSNLPPELLEQISLHVCATGFVDYVRTATVSKPWRDVLKTYTRLKNIPVIMVLKAPTADSCCSFYSIGATGNTLLNHFSHPDVSLIDPYCCKGCHNGWIFGQSRVNVLGDDVNSNGGDDVVWLFNPVRKIKVPLPSLGTLGLTHSTTIIKAVISSSPALEANRSDNGDTNCVVAATAYNLNPKARYIVYCKLGDTKWRMIEDSQDLICSELAYCNGSLYALCSKHNELLICDFDLLPRVRTYAKLPVCIDNKGHHFLSDLCGDILFIQCFLFHGHDPLPKVHLFKMEKNNQVWSKVESLGKHSLFLTFQSSLAILAANHPGVKENCIYFITGSSDEMLGIFSLANGGVEYTAYNLGAISSWSYGFWITPSW